MEELEDFLDLLNASTFFPYDHDCYSSYPSELPKVCPLTLDIIQEKRNTGGNVPDQKQHTWKNQRLDRRLNH